MGRVRGFYNNIENKLTAPICAVLIFVLGLACLAFFPIGRSADAWTHAYRVSGILNGDVIARPVDSISSYHNVPEESWGGAVSKDIVELSVQCETTRDPGVVIFESIVVSDDATSEVPYNNTAVYSPLAYVPQLIGFSIGKALGFDAQVQYYLAELCMLLLWTLFCTVAIMGLPEHRLIMLLLVICPVVMLPNAFAVSADGTVLASCILFSCYLYRCMLRKPAAIDYLILSFSGFLLVNAKFSFAPLIVLMVLPLFKWKDVKGPGAIPLAMLFVSAVSVLIWMKTGASGIPTSPARVPYAEVGERTAMLISAPLVVLGHILWSIVHFEASYSFGTQGTAVFWIAFIVMFVVLVIVGIRRSTMRRSGAAIASMEPALSFWFAVWIMVLVTVLVSYLALFLQYNLAENPGVQGVQYRYFVPYLPLAILMVLDCVPLAFKKKQFADRSGS